MHDRPLQRIVLADLHDTDRLGCWLAAHLPGGTCIGLIGTLGAGKTRLAQAIIAAHGVDRQAVTSPTFALLRSYTGKQPEPGAELNAGAELTGRAEITGGSGRMLHHLDAYRLHDEDEFLELGVEDLWEDDSALMLVEWAGRVEGCLPPTTLWIEIEWTPSERRTVTFRGSEDLWASRVTGLAAEFPSS